MQMSRNHANEAKSCKWSEIMQIRQTYGSASDCTCASKLLVNNLNVVVGMHMHENCSVNVAHSY